MNTRNIKISKATGEREGVQPLIQALYPLTPSRLSASLRAREPTAALPPLFTQAEGPNIQNTKRIKIQTTLIYIKQVKVKVVYVKRSWYWGSIGKIWISVLQWCELTLMYSCSTACKVLQRQGLRTDCVTSSYGMTWQSSLLIQFKFTCFYVPG